MKIPAINCWFFFYIFYIHDIRDLLLFSCVCDPGYEGDADVQCKPINPCEKPHRGGCHRQVLSPYRSKKKCTYTLIDNIDAKELNTL